MAAPMKSKFSQCFLKGYSYLSKNKLSFYRKSSNTVAKVASEDSTTVPIKQPISKRIGNKLVLYCLASGRNGRVFTALLKKIFRFTNLFQIHFYIPLLSLFY